MPQKEVKLKTKTVFTCDFLSVREDEVKLENSKTAQRVVVDHIGAAAVLPITKAKQVVLVRQYRYAVERALLEIPAGKKDTVDEDGKTCAMRELQEETNYTCDKLEKITDLYTGPGFTNECIELFIARDAYLLKETVASDPDEFLEVVVMPLEKAVMMAKSGEIQDAKTLVALLSVANLIES